MKWTPSWVALPLVGQLDGSLHLWLWGAGPWSQRTLAIEALDFETPVLGPLDFGPLDLRTPKLARLGIGAWDRTTLQLIALDAATLKIGTMLANGNLDLEALDAGALDNCTLTTWTLER